MNGKCFYLKKTKKIDRQHYFVWVQIKSLIVIIMLVLQFKNTGFAQQNTSPKVPDKIDSIHSSTDNKTTVAGGDSSVNDSYATYPGGDKAFFRYLIQNLSVPQYYTQKTDVSIIVTFTIDESGKLSNFHASDGPGPLKKEAIRLVKDSGRWIPAYKDGKQTTSERQQKISFKLNL